MPTSQTPSAHESGSQIRTQIRAKGMSRRTVAVAAVFLSLTASGSAQTQQLRGIPDDPRSNLPSVRGMLQRQQDRQIGTFSTRHSIEQSERRQTLERMNENNRDCSSPTGVDCAPRPK